MIQAEGLILAGGMSRRMGVHKGSLTCNGESFTEILVRELKQEVETVWLSVGCKAQGGGCRAVQEMKDAANGRCAVYERENRVSGCRTVQDIYAGCGPIGGLHAGLTVCGSEFLLVAACDMPLLKAKLFSFLYEELRQRGQKRRYDGVVPVTGEGIHPLAAVYRKSAAGIFKEQIEAGNYRLRDALGRLDILYIDVAGEAYFARMLQNINTPQDYASVKCGG